MPKPRGSLAISRRPHQDATLGGMKRLRRLRLLAASIIARLWRRKLKVSRHILTKRSIRCSCTSRRIWNIQVDIKSDIKQLCTCFCSNISPRFKP